MIQEYPKGQSRKISEHFSSGEFDCRCNYSECTITYVDIDLIILLEKKRALIGKPLHVDSGFRCVRHNKDVGGKVGSIHLTGKAADISLTDGTICHYIPLMNDVDGLGIYTEKKFLHLDVRYGGGGHMKARWVG